MNNLRINPYLNFTAKNKYAQEYRNTRNELVNIKYKLDNSEYLSPGQVKNLKTKFSYTIEKKDNKLNNTEIEQEVALTSLENKVIIKIQGPIYFLNINKIINEINLQLKESNDIVLDLQDAINIDCTSIEKLAKLDSSINVIGKNLTLINYPEKVGERLKKYYTYLM
jgi:MFS superfamily sulfate permease-like transporter